MVVSSITIASNLAGATWPSPLLQQAILAGPLGATALMNDCQLGNNPLQKLDVARDVSKLLLPHFEDADTAQLRDALAMANSVRESDSATVIEARFKRVAKA